MTKVRQRVNYLHPRNYFSSDPVSLYYDLDLTLDLSPRLQSLGRLPTPDFTMPAVEDNIQEVPDAAMTEPQTPTTKRKQMDTTPESYTLPREPPTRYRRAEPSATAVSDADSDMDKEPDEEPDSDPEMDDEPLPQPVAIGEDGYDSLFEQAFGRWTPLLRLAHYPILESFKQINVTPKLYGKNVQDKTTRNWIDLSKVTPRWQHPSSHYFLDEGDQKRKVVVSYEDDHCKRGAVELTLRELCNMHTNYWGCYRPGVTLGYSRPPTFHAFLLPGKPCHLVFDLDVKPDSAAHSDLLTRFYSVMAPERARRVQEQVFSRLDSFFQMIYGRPMCRDIVRVWNASGDWTRRRMSFHFHIISEGFQTLEELAKFVEAFLKWLEETYLGDSDLLLIRRDETSFVHSVDKQIYGTGQAAKTLRMAGSVKMEDFQKDIVRPLRPTVMQRGVNAMWYLLYSMPSDCIQLAPGQELLTFGQAEADKLAFPLAIPVRAAARVPAAADGDAAGDGEREEHAPIPGAVLREMIMALGEDRLKDRQQRNQVIWCIQASGGSKELALEYYKRCGQPDPEEAAERHWREAENRVGSKVNAGTLRNWLKKDLGEDEYKKKCVEWGLYRKRAPTRASLLADMLKHVRPTKIKKWDPVIKAMMVAGVSKERIIEFTDETDGADEVEECWETYNKMLGDGRLKHRPNDLLTIMKKHGLKQCYADDFKTRWKRGDRVSQDDPGTPGSPAKDRTGYAEEINGLATGWLETPGIKPREILRNMVKWAVQRYGKEPWEAMGLLMPHLNEVFKYVEDVELVYVRKPASAGFKWRKHEAKKLIKEVYAQHKLGSLSVLEWWFDHPDRQQYTTIAKLPPLLKDLQEPDSFNMWTGFPVEHYPVVEYPLTQKLQSLLDDYLDVQWDVCGGEKGDPKKEGFNWCCDHTATLLQLPGKKTGCHINFWSTEQGNGKSTPAYAIRALIGKEHSLAIEKNVAEVLFGKYNGHLEGMVLIELDDKCSDAAMKNNAKDLLSMITNKKQSIRRMHSNHETNVPAYEHYMGSGNSPPPHKAGDRRSCPFKAAHKYLGKPKFWARLYAGLDNPVFQRVLYQWYMARPINQDTNFQDTFPKHLAGVKDLNARSAPLLVKWLIESFLSKEPTERTTDIKAADLLASYNAYLSKLECKPTNAKILGSTIKDMNIAGLTKARSNDGVYYEVSFAALKKWVMAKGYLEEDDEPNVEPNLEDNVEDNIQ